MRWSTRIESWWRGPDGPRGAAPPSTPALGADPPPALTPPWPAREPEATPRAAALARAHHLRAALEALDLRLERWTDAAGVAQTRASRFASLARDVRLSGAFDPLRDALVAWAAGASAPDPRATDAPPPAAIAAASHWLAGPPDAALPTDAHPIARAVALRWLRDHPDAAADAGWRRGWTPRPLEAPDAAAFARWLAHGATGAAPTDTRSLLLRLATGWLEATLAPAPALDRPTHDPDARPIATETLAWLAEGTARPPPPAARPWLERTALWAWLASDADAPLPHPWSVRLRPAIAAAVADAHPDALSAAGLPSEGPPLDAPADIPAWLDAVDAATTAWRAAPDASVTRAQATAAVRLWGLLEAPARAAVRAFDDAREAAALRDDLAVLRVCLRDADPAAHLAPAPFRLTLDALGPPPPGATALPLLGPAWMPDPTGRGRSRAPGRRVPADADAPACPLEPGRCLCHAAGVTPCPVVRALASAADRDGTTDADDQG